MHLSVVIPAYNESKRIVPTLRSVHEYLSKQDYAYEIIVVNDGSKDNTAEVIEHLKREIPHLHLIDNHRNHGKGWVVRQGMLEAKGEYRLFMDADNSTTVDHLEKMMPYFAKGYDVIIASIAVPGAHIVKGGEEPPWRVLLGKLGNLWIQALAVPGIHDTQRGFKVFSSRAVEKIFPKLTILGWGMDVEILALARKFKYKIKEVPITWNNDPNSRVNFWAYPQVLMQTLQVRLNLIGRKYR